MNQKESEKAINLIEPIDAREKIITGNYFNKYASKNPAIKLIMSKYLETLFGNLRHLKFETVLEVGCGEGEILKAMKERYPHIRGVGLDIDKELIENIKIERFKFEVQRLDAKDFHVEPYDLVLCLEVLEHIKNYKRALFNLNNIKTSSILISVPNEPFFRLSNLARLKYLQRLGNTPGHVNNFTNGKFKHIIKEEFKGAIIKFSSALLWNFALILKEGEK